MTRMVLTVGLAWMLAVPVVAGAADDEPAVSNRDQAAAMLRRFVGEVEGFDAYTAIMTKQQRIEGELQPVETLFMKHRRAPECRYMKWLPGPEEGREIIFCAERYKGKIKFHQPGFFGWTMSLDPDGSFVKRSGNLRPPTEGGIFNLAERLQLGIEAQRSEAESDGDEPDVAISAITVHDAPARCLLPAGPPPDDGHAPYPIGKRELCFYDDNGLPAQIRMWHEDGRLMEHYSFRDFAVNPGLSDADFDVDNEDYDF
ncbi:DUF1571 domain-containing protein [uncultured Abyssibacter sp.]|uniref:DUF1571 domain-containing protein n=1 Tax=uncultured Abyssibacter sp. TaxID=2320202 RepID=UPI0032B16F08